MKKLTRKELLEIEGITFNLLNTCARTAAFRKRFGSRGTGYTHYYGPEEIKAILEVVKTKEAWKKAMRFGT